MTLAQQAAFAAALPVLSIAFPMQELSISFYPNLHTARLRWFPLHQPTAHPTSVTSWTSRPVSHLLQWQQRARQVGFCPIPRQECALISTLYLWSCHADGIGKTPEQHRAYKGLKEESGCGCAGTALQRLPVTRGHLSTDHPAFC